MDVDTRILTFPTSEIIRLPSVREARALSEIFRQTGDAVIADDTRSDTPTAFAIQDCVFPQGILRDRLEIG